MKRNIIRNFFGVVLVLIIITSIFLVYKNIDEKEIQLDNVSLKGNVSNSFALMLEQSNGTYEETTNTEWPSEGYLFNKNLSGCIDTNGNVIENALSYENGTIKLKTKHNTYCYIYFDIDYKLSQLCNNGDNLGSCLTINNEEIDSLNDNIEGGLYRYQGTNEIVDDNYICFGTTSKEECTSNTDKYMYRIIGIDENNQLKLIKKEALNDTMQWYTNYTTDITWQNSTIYTNINGEKYLTNNVYIPSGWSSKIVNYDWKYGDVTDVNVTLTELYALENKWNDTVNSKIGIMYIHDYAYAYQSGGLNCSGTGAYSKCKTSWLHLSNNDTNLASSWEWTMTRYGYYSDGSAYGAWVVVTNGHVGWTYLTDPYAIRPTFYLNSDEQYISGDGTIDNPIILADKEPPEGNSISINNNTTYTTSTNVTLTLSSSGATEMCISESTSCTNWEEYKTSKSMTLSNTLGIKTVYVMYRDEVGNISEQINDTISLYEIVSVPSQNGSLTYTGSSQTAKWNNYDSSKLTIGGTISSTNAGTFNTTFTPKTNYIWSDGTQTAKTVSWSIGKTSGSLSVSPTSLTINAGKTGTIAVTRAGDGTITATSSNTSVATVSVSGTTVTVTGKMGGTATITIKVAAGTNHTAPSNKTVSVFVSQAFGEYLIAKKTTGWNSTAYSGMYRYIGTSVENYVKLGSVLYRVIGVTSAANSTLGLAKNQVKLILNAPGIQQSWNSVNNDSSWESSSAYSYLQGSSVLGNTSIIPSGWSSKISSVKWYVGAVTSGTPNASTVFSEEDNSVTSSTSKIGLLYLSDHYYAYTAGGGTNCYSTDCSSWTSLYGSTQWTMIRSSSIYYTWIWDTNDRSSVTSMTYTAYLRPVFYLTTSVKYKSGSGTEGDPFIIE